jgi:hypothetical protein
MRIGVLLVLATVAALAFQNCMRKDVPHGLIYIECMIAFPQFTANGVLLNPSGTISVAPNSDVAFIAKGPAFESGEPCGSSGSDFWLLPDNSHVQNFCVTFHSPASGTYKLKYIMDFSGCSNMSSPAVEEFNINVQ